MTAFRSVSIVALFAMILCAPLSAKTLRNADEPAEFPPSSFTGSQYVDSRGCVYVRAGGAGGTQWVPRVTRSRDVMCGFKPTQVAGSNLPVIKDPVAQAPAMVAPVAVATAAPKRTTPTSPMAVRAATPQVVAAQPVQAPRPATVTLPRPSVAVAQMPKPATVQLPSSAPVQGARTQSLDVRNGPQTAHPSDYVMKRLPAGVTVRTAAGEKMTTTQPTMVRVPVASVNRIAAPVRTAYVQPAYVQPSSSGCSNLSGNAAQFMTATDVRCGPQPQHPSSFVVRRQAQALQAQAHSVDLHRAAAAQGFTIARPVTTQVPAGYSRVWDDGRLNPNRGPRTYAGDLQQAQVWTQDTPARDVYAPKPKTFWQSLFGTGQSKTTVYVPQAQVAMAAPSRISTKSAAPIHTPKTQSASANLRYVQVGAFGVAANADNSIARLTSLGVPVSSQVLNRGGKSIKMVLAGPFASSQQTLAALGSIRSAGYADAFARK